LEETKGEGQHPCLIAPIDWRDIYFAFFVGVVAAFFKLAAVTQRDWNLGGSDALAASLLFVGYIFYRARHEPEKLDEWGLTTKITGKAVFVGAGLLCLGVLALAALGMALVGGLSFQVSYFPRMLDYTTGAFPQQFAMCSVFLVNLAKLRVLQGLWRLPMLVGLLFGLAHFWTPAPIPGTVIPLQVPGTIPMGFLCAWYFLRFRTILPLILCHIVLFVLLVHWVERHL